MNRAEFMKELKYLLSDLPDEEKEDALAYYRDYLEEAGEAEGDVIREFGSPERIAAIIRADIQGDMKESGAFTDRGFEDERFRDPGYQVAKRLDLPEVNKEAANDGRQYGPQGTSGFGTAGGNGKPGAGHGGNEQMHHGQSDREYSSDTGTGRKNTSVWKIVLLILLVLAAAPVLLAVGGSLVGAGVGILTAVLVVVIVFLFLLAVLTLAFVIGGFALVVVGIINMFSEFTVGLFMAGTGLVMLAFGIVGVVISVWFYGKLVPWMFRGCINGINRLIHRRVRGV